MLVFNKIPGHFRLCWLTAILPVLAVLLFCARDYNPFTDVSNSRAVITYLSIANNDTINIYGCDTLELRMALPAMVDSVIVNCAGNRFFEDSLVTFPDVKIDSAYRFPLSFYDTGALEIKVVTFRCNSEQVMEQVKFRVCSGLFQSGINGELGSSVSLSTSGVKAPDVLYNWDFGRNTVVSSIFPETEAVINDADLSDSGLLYVCDLSGNHPSPGVKFGFALEDNTGPEITCINDGFSGKDTLIAGKPDFSLSLSITDRDRAITGDAFVNGEKFDLAQPPLFVKKFENMDTVTGYIAAVVEATDDPFSNNRTGKTFYLGYSDSAGSLSGDIRIRLLIPPHDSGSSASPTLFLIGLIENLSGGPVDLSMTISINKVKQDYNADFYGSNLRFDWLTVVTLPQNENNIVFEAKDSTGSVVSEKSITVFRNTGLKDSVPPVIVEVTCNGVSIDHLCTPDSQITIRAVVFDADIISEVTLNSEPMSQVEGGGGFIWEGNAVLKHRISGNRIIVSAKDNAGLKAGDSSLVYTNNPPILAKTPLPPLPLFVNTVYNDTLVVSDKDGDKITITKLSGPEGYSVSQNGVINWTPGADRTGANLIEILFTDRIQPQKYRDTIYVEDEQHFSRPSFNTAEEDFPSFLEVGRDTLSLLLTVDSGTGQMPYAFTAAAATSVTAPKISQSRVIWKPEIGDTGYQRLIISVADAFNERDTVSPVIFVAPPNRPCSLSVSFDIDTLPDGKVNLNSLWEPGVLEFRIHDPDNPAVEKHTVEARGSAFATVSIIDSAGYFTVSLDPLCGLTGTDTVHVTVSDHRGLTYTKNIRLYYGLPPAAPVPEYPAVGGKSAGYSVFLQWSCTDPDGDAMTYRVFCDTSFGAGQVFDTVSQPDAVFRSMRPEKVHYWKVIASDGRFETESPVWQFTSDTYRRIFMNTSTSGAGVNSDCEGFPVLVRLDQTNFDFSRAKADGADIRFSKPDNTELSYEIERWNKTGKKAEIWVRADTVRGNSASGFMVMYFNDSLLADASSPENVFRTSDGFCGVWHLNESDSAGLRMDATSNSAHLLWQGETDGTEDIPIGCIAGADSASDTTNGKETYLITPHKASQSITGPITMSAWVRGWVAGGKIMAKHNWGPLLRQCGYCLYFGNKDEPGQLRMELSHDGYSTEDGGISSWARSGAGNVVDTTTWNFVAGYRDGSKAYFCINGNCEPDVIDDEQIGQSIYPTTAELTLFANKRNADVLNTLNRPMDEVRLCSTARGADWLKLCFENQRLNESRFITITE